MMRQSRVQHRPPIEVLNGRCSPDCLALQGTGQRSECRVEVGLQGRPLNKGTLCLISALCILLSVLSSMAQAATYTVAQTGANFTTIQACANIAGPGDTCLIR